MTMTSDNTLLYHPAAALVVFEPKGGGTPYIEYYGMDESGFPVNPHPLTVREAQSLAKVLDTRGEEAKAFLKPKGLLPPCVLHLNPADNGSVVWYTKPQRFFLHFTENLSLPSGEVALPALIWKADRKKLHLYAVARRTKPNGNTPLCYAPVLNAYRDGSICMGNVDVRIKTAASLEEFTAAWQHYFFGSYFSHLIDSNNPVNGNLLSLYRELMQSGSPFPTDALVPTRLTLKDLL
jgi:PRTRC genetic system protein B